MKIENSTRCIKAIIAIPCLNIGGTEIQTLYLAKALLAQNHKVSVVCYFDWKPNVAEMFRVIGCKVDFLELNRTDSLIKIIFVLRRYFKLQKPDAVHIQYIAPGALPIIAARLAGISTVFATVHQPGTPYGRSAHLLIRISALLCKKFMAVSQMAEQSWFGSSMLFDPQNPETIKRKHITIYNSIDLNEIDLIIADCSVNDQSKNYKSSDREFHICAVARLNHEKGIDLLLDAFARLVRQSVNGRLTIVGDGPDKELLNQQSQRLDITQYVNWKGNLTRSEALKTILTADVVVCPSRFEGFGLTAAEAMALGKPVIATRVGGLPEVIDHEHTGLLVSHENNNELTDALAKLNENPGLCRTMGQNGRKRVEKNFSFRQYRKLIAGLYRSHMKPE